MESLPHEIFLDILSRLPITSLLNCKHVCRSWHYLIEDTRLAAMHFSHAADNDPCLILHCDYPIQNQLRSVNLSTPHEGNVALKEIQVLRALPEFDVVGSCNGLLCLRDSSYGGTVFIYNPFTRNCIELPIPREYRNEKVVFGFGFHPITKEYKVIRAVYFEAVYFGPLPLPSDVQIFTLGNTTWRWRSVGNISYRVQEHSTQALVNGRVHWVTLPIRYDPRTRIVSFDLVDEQFRELPGPECGAFQSCSYHLVVLRGYLSAAVYHGNGKSEIWVMKKYDVKESWTKEYSIGSYVPIGMDQDLDQSFKVSKFYGKASFVQVLCLLKNGEILLEHKCRALVSYDPNTEKFKHHVIPGMPYLFETLVLVGSLNWIDSNSDV